MSTAHTPRRAIRVPDPLWERAKAKAERTGEPSLSEVVRRKLDEYAPEDEQR